MADDLAAVQEQITKLRSYIAEQKQLSQEKVLAQLSQDDEELPCQFRSTKELQGHFGKIYAMHWASDSRHLASASQDGKLMIWDGQTTNKRHMINLRSSWVMTCAYAPSQSFVACGGLDNLCSIYPVSFESAETHERPKHELSRHDGYLSCCRFLNDYQIITSSGDGSLILWDIQQSSAVVIFLDHEADVMSVSTLPGDNANIFVSGSCDQTAKVWDARAGEKSVQSFTGHTSDINSVQWFPNHQSFGSGSDDATVRLFDMRAYAELNQYSNDGIRCGVTSIDFSKTGKYMFCGYDDKPYAAVWNTLSAEKHQDLKNTTRVSCLGVPDSGYCLCTGSWDNNLQIWASS